MWIKLIKKCKEINNILVCKITFLIMKKLNYSRSHSHEACNPVFIHCKYFQISDMTIFVKIKGVLRMHKLTDGYGTIIGRQDIVAPQWLIPWNFKGEMGFPFGTYIITMRR